MAEKRHIQIRWRDRRLSRWPWLILEKVNVMDLHHSKLLHAVSFRFGAGRKEKAACAIADSSASWSALQHWLQHMTVRQDDSTVVYDEAGAEDFEVVSISNPQPHDRGPDPVMSISEISHLTS